MFAEQNLEKNNGYRSKLNTWVKDLENHHFKVDLMPLKQKKFGEDDNEEDRNQIP